MMRFGLLSCLWVNVKNVSFREPFQIVRNRFINSLCLNPIDFRDIS